jgi:elongation factor 1-alpha
MSKDGKTHLSLVICGHVDAGKSTTTGRLIFELGGISERDMEKLKAEADALGKGSFAFAFYMDRQKEERARGVTISCTTKEFYTDSYHYTIIDAPGHRDFIKNMITGASQADVAVLMVPSDGNFTASIAKGNHKVGEVQGQTRQHARLINLLGCKQLIVGVNKMDCDVAKYGKARYDEVANEIKDCLVKVGWKKKFVLERVPIIPISGWMGDNLLKKSANMDWWKGADVKVGKKKVVHVDTLYDALEKFVEPPKRDMASDLRMPVSGVYKIKGVGDVITGRVEQGKCTPGTEVIFLPTHTSANKCAGKVFTVEMHHTNVEYAGPGDNVGLNVKGLEKLNMPQVGDVMVDSKDEGLKRCGDFTAAVQVLDHPGQLKVGYTPIAYVRTGRAPVRMTKIDWKIGKSTGGQKVEDPAFVKRNEMAQVVFTPQQPFVVDAFKRCEGLGRVAIMEGNGVVMLGKIQSVNWFVEKSKK